MAAYYWLHSSHVFNQVTFMSQNIISACTNIYYTVYSRATRWAALVMLITASLFMSPSFAAPDARQIKLLTNNCLQCHVNADSTAPLMGVTKDWEAVIAQGEEATMKNVVLGIRGMPPLGYCSACSEQDLRELVRLVAGFPDKVQ
jgi:cytochrome c5